MERNEIIITLFLTKLENEKKNSLIMKLERQRCFKDAFVMLEICVLKTQLVIESPLMSLVYD